MARALRFALPLSLILWGVLGLLAWFAPEVVLALAIGALLAVVADIALDW